MVGCSESVKEPVLKTGARKGLRVRVSPPPQLWYTGLVPELYKRHSNTTCLVCKKPVYKRPSQIERNRGRVFCGMVCYGISCRKENPCVICKKPILGGLHKKSCSRACANAHRVTIKHKFNKPRDKVKTNRHLKLRLLKKRRGVCERCNYDIYEILQVHHKDRNHKNINLENLELICPNCHAKEHFLEKSWLKGFLD